MYPAHPTYIAEINLGERCPKHSGRHSADQLEPCMQFCIYMGDPAWGIELAQNLDPTPMDRPVEKGGKPHSASDSWTMAYCVSQSLTRYRSNLHWPGGDQVVVQLTQHKAMQIDEVAWNIQSNDPATGVDMNCPKDKAFHQQVAVLDRCGFLRQKSAVFMLLDIVNHAFDMIEIFLTKALALAPSQEPSCPTHRPPRPNSLPLD